MTEGFSVETALYAMAKRALVDAKEMDFRIFILDEVLRHMDSRLARMSPVERELFERFAERVLLDILYYMRRPLLVLHVVNTLSVVLSKLSEALGIKRGGD